MPAAWKIRPCSRRTPRRSRPRWRSEQSPKVQRTGENGWRLSRPSVRLQSTSRPRRASWIRWARNRISACHSSRPGIRSQQAFQLAAHRPTAPRWAAPCPALPAGALEARSMNTICGPRWREHPASHTTTRLLRIFGGQRMGRFRGVLRRGGGRPAGIALRAASEIAAASTAVDRSRGRHSAGASSRIITPTPLSRDRTILDCRRAQLTNCLLSSGGAGLTAPVGALGGFDLLERSACVRCGGRVPVWIRAADVLQQVVVLGVARVIEAQGCPCSRW